MMNAREKSDSATVAGKSSNKSGSRKVGPDTEAMERRAEAKENANQQSARQNRESVKQALSRVRQAARLRKKERFTALFHHITIELLWLSLSSEMRRQGWTA